MAGLVLSPWSWHFGRVAWALAIASFFLYWYQFSVAAPTATVYPSQPYGGFTLTHAWICKDTVTLEAGKNLLTYTASECLSYPVSQSPNNLRYPLYAGSVAFAFTVIGLLASGLANLISRSHVNNRASADFRGWLAFLGAPFWIPALHFTAAGAFIVAWGTFLAEVRYNYAAPALLGVVSGNPAAVVTSWAPGAGFILAVTASLLELLAGAVALPTFWTEATTPGPTEAESLVWDKRPGQTAALWTGWIVWIADITSMWTAWYTFTLDTSNDDNTQSRGGAYTLLSGLWMCSTNVGNGPNAPASYCDISDIAPLPGDRSVNYPYIAGTVSAAFVIACLVFVGAANLILDEKRRGYPILRWLPSPWVLYVVTSVFQFVAWGSYLGLFRANYTDVPAVTGAVSSSFWGPGLGLVVIASVLNIVAAAVSFAFRGEFADGAPATAPAPPSPARKAPAQAAPAPAPAPGAAAEPTPEPAAAPAAAE